MDLIDVGSHGTFKTIMYITSQSLADTQFCSIQQPNTDIPKVHK